MNHRGHTVRAFAVGARAGVQWQRWPAANSGVSHHLGRRHMRRLIVAAIAMVSALGARADAWTGVWGIEDDRGTFSIRLNNDSTCEIASVDNLSGGVRAKCTYWIHGSRVRIRARGVRDGEGLNRLDIEYDPQTQTLILHGDRPRVLTRDWARSSYK